MSAVAIVLREQFRRRWRSWVGLALLVGFAAGTTMALAAAARRSERAYDRFADTERAADVVMTGASSFGLVGTVDLDAVARSRYVAATAPAFVTLPFAGRTDTGRRIDAVDVFPVAAEDTRLGRTVERWKMLAGRRARPTRPHEATASFVLAERLGLHVGSRLELRLSRADRFPAVAARLLADLHGRITGRTSSRRTEPEYANGPRVRFTIVGIEASPAEFPPLLTDLAPVLHLTPAFAHRYRASVVGSPLAYFRLRRPSDLRPLQLDVERTAAGGPVSFVSTRANQAPKVQRAIHAEAIALAIVAALVGITAAVAIGQALTRQTLATSVDFPSLRAVGMRTRQLRALVLARVLAIGAVGAAVAALLATFGAQFALLPLARKADLDIGPHLDIPVLAIGTAAVLGFALLVGWISARVATRAPATARPDLRRGRVAGDRAIGALPPPMGIGVRLALRRAARAIPPWATIGAGALTVALLTGALTFTASLQRVLDEPHRYGWNWDVRLGAPGLPDIGASIVPTLRADPRLAAVSSGTVTQVDARRARIDVLALDRVKGRALPSIIDGRAPRRPGEIALGGRSMTRLRTHVGGHMDARIGTRTARLRVVGRAVFPEFGDAGQLGTGALMTRRGIDRLLPGAPTNIFLVRFADPSHSTASGAALERGIAPIPAHFQARPQDLIELSQGGGLLATLVVVLAILGFAALSHALVTSVRSRSGTFAVLRVLGFTRAQTRATVAWQTLTLAAAAVLVGVPLGSVGGRWAWRRFADQLGVASDARFPSPGVVLLVVGGAVLVALVAAVVPARIAARVRSVGVLRSD